MQSRAIRCVLGLFASAVAVLAVPSPGYAHAPGPSATDFHTVLTSVTPAVNGLDIRVTQGGSRLTMQNKAAHDVLILGYENEPYLRMRDQRIEANSHSPTAYINEDLDGAAPDSATAAPSWQLISHGDEITWHDHRTHWMSDFEPAIVNSQLESAHRLRNWIVPLIVDDKEVLVRGTLDYLPTPSTSLWWSGIALATAGFVAATLASSGRRTDSRNRRPQLLLGGVLIAASVAELADNVGRVLDQGALKWGVITSLATDETYGTACAIAGAIVGIWAIGFALPARRYHSALLAIVVVGTCLAVVGGLGDIAVFTHGRATSAWSSLVGRLLTATVITLGSTAAITAWLCKFRSDSPVSQSSTAQISATSGTIGTKHARATTRSRLRHPRKRAAQPAAAPERAA